MKEQALEILEEIRENVCICCAVTMEPDEVETLIDKLKTTIKTFSLISSNISSACSFIKLLFLCHML